MPTLGVVMIVKNEAQHLDACLKSVASIADEIVIADTGSTDETPAIALRYHARVLNIPWNNDFAEARNRVLAEATSDWLLHLDADECLDPKSAQRVRTIVDTDGNGADAIEVTLANYCDDPRAWRWVPATPGDPWARGRSGYIAVGLLRLFRNHRGYHYREPVHENITESVLEAGGKVRDEEPIVIHHYGYGGSGSAKGRLYLDIAKRKVEQRPNDAKAWHDLAEQLLSLNETDEAEEAARRALALEPLHLSAATTLCNILLNRGDVDEARALLEGLEAARIAPPHVVTALGAIACRQGRIQEACERLEAVLSEVPIAIMARLYYARVLDLSSRAADARWQLDMAKLVCPSLVEIDNRLKAHDGRSRGEQAIREGSYQQALATLVAALRDDPEDPLIHLDVGICLERLGQQDAALRSFTRAARLAASLEGRREML